MGYMVTFLELASTVLIVVGVGLVSVPVALICAGIAGLVFAIAIERKTD